MPTSPLGHTIDPLNYILGVAVSGRLRLHALDPDSPDPGPEIATLVAPVVDPARLAAVLPADGSAHAGLVWAEELSAASGDDRYIDFLIQVADAYLDTNDDGLPAPMDPDDRVEEVFFVAALLGRAFRHTADARYAGTLTRALSRVAAQPESGLWWHGKASPVYWGRGNAFASLNARHFRFETRLIRTSVRSELGDPRDSAMTCPPRTDPGPMRGSGSRREQVWHGSATRRSRSLRSCGRRRSASPRGTAWRRSRGGAGSPNRPPTAGGGSTADCRSTRRSGSFDAHDRGRDPALIIV